MGEIAAAFGTVHAPQLIIRPPDENPQMLDASIAAMRELGKILDETKPDVILFTGTDFQGSSMCLPNGQSYPSLPAPATSANSNLWVQSC